MKNDIKFPTKRYVDSKARRENKLQKVGIWLLVILVLGTILYNARVCTGDYEGQSEADGAVCTPKIGSILVNKITN